MRNAGEGDRAGEAVNQRRAVEQHAGRQRAEHEVLQARFGRAQVVAMARGNDVKRQAHQLEAEIKRDQIRRRDQHQHAERREHDQNRVFEALLSFALGVIDRQQDRCCRTDQSENLQKPCESVDDEAAVKADKLAFREQQQDHARGNQKHDRAGIDYRHHALIAIGTQHQQQHGADAKHDLRQQRQERSDVRSGVHALPRHRRLHGGQCVLVVVQQLRH